MILNFVIHAALSGYYIKQIKVPKAMPVEKSNRQLKIIGNSENISLF
jgi:hypothetical protein